MIEDWLLALIHNDRIMVVTVFASVFAGPVSDNSSTMRISLNSGSNASIARGD